jgi:hypothetical protein
MLYAALALAIPLPALALTGDEGGSGLSVEASLEGCGVNGPRIVCEINTSFGSIEGADYYTASVTAPDGSVTDFGRVAGAGGGGTSLWVPYVGNGTYSVTVTAWGDERTGGAEVIDRDGGSTSGEVEKVRKRDATEVGDGTYEVPEADQQGEPAEEPAEVPAPVPEATEPPCPPDAAVEPTPAPAPPVGEGASGAGDVAQSATTEASPSVAPLPPGCPEPAPPPPAP